MANTPGQFDVATYEPVEIRAIPGHEITVAVTLAPTSDILAAGTILGMNAATKLYSPYDGAATDGTEIPAVVLAETVAASALNQNAAAYIKGVFYKDRLIGFDGNAATILNAREPIPDLLII